MEAAERVVLNDSVSLARGSLSITGSSITGSAGTAGSSIFGYSTTVEFFAWREEIFDSANPTR